MSEVASDGQRLEPGSPGRAPGLTEASLSSLAWVTAAPQGERARRGNEAPLPGDVSSLGSLRGPVPAPDSCPLKAESPALTQTSAPGGRRALVGRRGWRGEEGRVCGGARGPSPVTTSTLLH